MKRLNDFQSDYFGYMDNIYVTKILFFFVFVATILYWITSFSDHKNILFKVPRWHRIPYKVGLIIIMVSSLNIFSKDGLRTYDINMFLIGACLVIGMVAIWDKKIQQYYNPPDDEN